MNTRRTNYTMAFLLLTGLGQQSIRAQQHKPFGEIGRADTNSTLNMHLYPEGEFAVGEDPWGDIVRVNMLAIKDWSKVPGVKKAWIMKGFEGEEGMAFHPIISEVKDIDGDGTPDIFRCRSEHEGARIERLRYDDGAVVWESEPMAALHGDESRLPVFDLDGDGVYSVLHATRGGTWCINAKTGKTEWSAGEAVGDIIVGHFLDKTKQAVMVRSDGTLRCYDEKGNLIWTHETGLKGGAAYAHEAYRHDADGDGLDEIFVNWQKLTMALRGDGTVLWKDSTQQHHSDYLACADVDADGRTELIYDHEGCDAQKGPAYIVDAMTGTVKTRIDYRKDGLGHAQNMAVGDFIPDSRGLEIALCAKNGNLHLWDATGKLLWKRHVPSSLLSKGDWDGDGIEDIACFALGANVDGMFSVWNGKGERLYAISFLPSPSRRTWSDEHNGGSWSHAMPGGHEGVRRQVDLDGNGRADFIMPFGAWHWGSDSILFLMEGKEDDLAWPVPEVENRPGCYWWWMGSAVDKENITWNLETMRRAGMGGGTIVPIYGVKGYEDNYIQHLSPTFVQMVSHASKEAKRLGMWVDMTTGTGWPFGGPMITDTTCDATVVYKDGRLSQKFSGRNVKRAAPGGEGMAINPFSAKAMDDYLGHFDGPFGAEDVVMPRAMYHDSYEFSGNWCRELPEEFSKRRGYDLMKHLPELLGQQGDAETIARIKSDYRETLSDLHLDYLRTWVKWSASKGCTTRNQAHGSPSNLLDLYAASGIPETETFGASPFNIPGIRREKDNVDGRNVPRPLIMRMASSAAHVAGKPLVASESCTWIRNHFRTALSQAKPEIDQLFLNGINHIFFHGTCYSPKDAPWPGWLFYASFEYNPRNAIWRDAPLFNAYITRCQSILQSGTPDNDVAVYWPVYDIWHNSKGMQQMLTVHHPEWLTGSSCGKAATQLKEEGFGFDFISDRQLIAGQSKVYKAVVIPKTGYMPLETAKKLLELSTGGQPVLFLDSLPADVPGFNRLEERRATLKRLLQGQEELVVKSASLKEALAKTAALREPMVDQGLDFVRRRHDDGYHYFVANMGTGTVDRWVTLGAPFTSAVIMDPRSARTGVAVHRGHELYVQLKPGDTRILRTFDEQNVAGGQWPVRTSAGQPLLVNGSWKIKFIDGGPKLPADITTTELKSWTVLGDEEARRFAGTARYSIGITIPQGVDDWVLDLGDVRESARVFINGREAAGLYSVPFSAPVGDNLHPGRNLLEIELTNLSANRIRDLDARKVNWQNFHDINFVNHHYRKFDASTWPLTPSGLLGPVTLTPMRHTLQRPGPS